jgi:hypothetical protein
MQRLSHFILLCLWYYIQAEDRTWQSSCCGIGRTFPKNWTDASCWSRSAISSLPTPNDRTIFQLSTNCDVRIKDTDSISIQELYIQNAGLQMQFFGSGSASKNWFSASTYTVESYSTLTFVGLNTGFGGTSSLLGTLNLTDCRANGLGNITVSNTGQLILLRSAPMTLEFHVDIINRGLLSVQSTTLVSSSKVQNFWRMVVDISLMAEIQGASGFYTDFFYTQIC